jgi:hypothetical protein
MEVESIELARIPNANLLRECRFTTKRQNPEFFERVIRSPLE